MLKSWIVVNSTVSFGKTGLVYGPKVFGETLEIATNSAEALGFTRTTGLKFVGLMPEFLPGAINMLHRRELKGANPADSVRLLAELVNHVTWGDNLAHALVYNGFATERQAAKAVAA